MIVDFHAHTRESDGSLAPQELADCMRERGTRVFSITDHDTLRAYGQFQPADGMRVVTGIEINTTYRDGEVHILGFRLPLGDAVLNAVIERNRSARRTRIGRMVDQLRRAGHAISLDDVHAEAYHNASLGRPHVGRALIRLGIAPDIESAFRQFLRRGKPGYVPSTHITPKEAIDVVNAAGGIAVLAHPGRMRDDGIIAELVEYGLAGLEVFYPSHEPAQVQYFRDVAKRYGLVMTGGSDFHDIRYNARGVGMEVDDDAIRPFLDLVLDVA